MPINKAVAGQYCDYCKAIFGKKDGSLHPLARTQAICTVESESERFKGNSRSYCQKHLLIVADKPTVNEAILQLVEWLNHGKELLNV